MRIVIVGPGRAGGSLALAAAAAGHRIAALVTRRPDDREAARWLGAGTRLIGEPLPEAELLAVAVRDQALSEVADALAPQAGNFAAAVHLSGLAPVSVLRPLAAAGAEIGSFHPLQTLPDWHRGSRSLAGAGAAITAPPGLAGMLEELAESLGMTPLRLAEEQKPLYHAAAAAASNYVVTALHVAQTLFAAAGVDYRAARPLVETAVANVFEEGARAALTGPIARGDLETAAGQVRAVEKAVPHLAGAFRDFGRATADLAGTAGLMSEVLR